MIALVRLLPLVLLPLTAATDAREARPQDPTQIAQDPSEIPIEGTELTLGDLDSRLTVPVAVGGTGPFNFVIDTGAERTVVSRELAGSLGLEQGRSVNLLAMSGRRRVDTVIVPELMIETIGDRHRIVAPALLARNLGASGLLGIDTLQGHAVSIDFDTNLMTVRRSARRSAARSRSRGDEIVVTARSQFGQLIVTDAQMYGTRVRVVIDTGAQVSIGNSALRRKVAKRLGQTRPIELVSVLGDRQLVDYTTIPDVRIGQISYDTLPVAFSDVPPFERFGLTEKPALLLGMDALRSFRRVDIDFANRQIRFFVRDSDSEAEPEPHRRDNPLRSAPAGGFGEP